MEKSTLLLKLDHRLEKNHQILEMSCQILKKGGIIIFPTETVYGIGALMKNKKAVSRIYQLRNRPKNKALLILIASKGDLNKFVYLNSRAKKIINKFWPGPLTIIFKKKNNVPNFITAKKKTVAIRMPENKFLLALIKKVGQPIVAPSANLSGRSSSIAANGTLEDFFSKVDLILDGGKTKYRKESTILDLTQESPKILREGAISKEKLEKYL
jgi:L-threonylcarbamoyladenylate synthase